MSGKSREKMQISYLHKIIERLLIFTVISSFVFCLLGIIKDIALSNQKDIIALYTYLAVLVTQLLSFIIISIYFNENSKTANFFRFFTFYIFGLAIALYFLRAWVSLPITFFFTALQTVLYYKIYQPFFEHDSFERQCIAKNASSLQKELYDYNMHLSQSAVGYRQNKTMFVVMGAILTAASAVCLTSSIPLSLLTIIFLLTYLVAMSAHFFLYAYYVKEASYASNGFANVFNFRLKTIGTSVIIFALCFAVGLLVSSNHSPLKLYYLLYFFKLFKGKGAGAQSPAAPQIELDDYQKRLREIQSFQQAVEDRDTKGTDYFAIICGLFFVIAITWFFLKPFVTKRFSAALRGVDLKKIFKNFFINLAKYIKNLFARKIKRPLVNSAGATSFFNEMEELLQRSKKSKEKRAELDRLSRVFVKLIDWGQEHEILYTKNLAPAEYTSLFKNKDADLAGHLFEQSLYAKEPLSPEEEADFNKAIEAVIAGSR